MTAQPMPASPGETLEALRRTARDYKSLEFKARRAARRMSQLTDHLQQQLAERGVKLELVDGGTAGRHSDGRDTEGPHP